MSVSSLPFSNVTSLFLSLCDSCRKKLVSPVCVFTAFDNASVGFPDGSVVKNPFANAGESGLIPGSGRSPGVGNGNPLQYSCLGNPLDRRASGLQSMGSQRVGHDLVTKQRQQQQQCFYKRTLNYYIYLCLWLSHLLDFELFEVRSLDSPLVLGARQKQI